MRPMLERYQETKGGRWDVRDSELHDTASLTCWAVVNFSGETLEISDCKTAMMRMRIFCEKLG